MSDLLEKLHIDAGLNLLRADTGLTVYPDAEGNVPLTPSPPYVRVHTVLERPPDAPGNALAGLSTSWTVRWFCHCVGGTEYAAAAVAMRVRAALLDVRPTITGRSCGLIRWSDGQPTTRDETTGVLLMDRVEVYRLTTNP